MLPMNRVNVKVMGRYVTLCVALVYRVNFEYISLNPYVDF